jgi:hypothetical protein
VARENYAGVVFDTLEALLFTWVNGDSAAVKAIALEMKRGTRTAKRKAR